MYLKRLIKYRNCELGSEFYLNTESFSSIMQYYKKNKSNDTIHTKKDLFFDKEERTVIFRGINISAKIPLTDPTLGKNDPKVSFVNTPFPIRRG